MAQQTQQLRCSSPNHAQAPTSNGPAGGGTSAAVAGANFAPADPTASLRLGITACATAAWISSTAVYCGTPAGAGGSLGLALTAAEVVGSYALGFSYDAPAVQSVGMLILIAFV